MNNASTVSTINTKRSRAQQKKGLESLLSQLGQLSCVLHFLAMDRQKKFAGFDEFEKVLLRNASIDSSLLTLRKLDDFLAARRGQMI